MPIYLLIIFVFLAAFLGSNKKYFLELSYFMIFISLFVFPVLIGINSDRSDFFNYLSFFQEVPTSIFSSDFFTYASQQHAEIGYNYFQAIVKFFINSATFFFIVFAFTSIFIRYRYYRYFLSFSDTLIAVFAFLSHEFLRKDCVQIRNGMASAIVLFALIYLFKNKRIKFLFLILLACAFHSVAIIAVPLLFVRLDSSRLWNVVLLFVFSLSFIVSVLFPVRNVLLLFASMLPKSISIYLDMVNYLAAMSLTHPVLLKQTGVVIYVFYKRKKLFSDKVIYFLFQVYLISTCYYLFFRDFEILAARFGSLFSAVEAPLLLCIINKSCNTIIKKYGLCLFYFMFLLMNILTYEYLGFKIEIY